MTELTKEQVTEALEKVIDPEIGRPISELNMIGEIEITDTELRVQILLTIAGCPMRGDIEAQARRALNEVKGERELVLTMTPMTDEQRSELREKLSGPTRENPFTKPGSLTRIYAITSGKGGVGKSSITTNLAAAMAAQGLKVGVLDADIYGFSIPRMLGVENAPTIIDGMIVPPLAHGVKVISIGMFVPEGEPVVWRGPMLHRALQQFLTDVHWGDLDALLLDLPPGTGDVAISLAGLLPDSEIIVVTTPQVAAAEVAGRAGAIAAQTHQRVLGVIENMSYLPGPDGTRVELFGSGGGEQVSNELSELLGYQVPLLGMVPIDIALRQGADSGQPAATASGDSESGRTLTEIAQQLAKRARGLAGRQLGVQPL
ncbi:MAG: Mrp/NBP35 family ATP-binding protein [Varibaculum sp.]|nr:Mrp/NBP35 family ATP-binding protein [Varibaculum sp.]